jgi:xylulokinase
MYESCIRTGTFLIDWMIREMFGADAGAEKHLFKQLEDEAAAVGIGAGGAMLVPYWSGVMTPYWRTEARGLIAGLNASHKRGHVYRALLDGIALEQTIMTDKIAETGQPIDHFVAIGGGSNSDLWCQILADATGRSIVRSSTVEASSLGAAMAAARGAGWFATVPEASAAMAGPTTRRFEPDAKANARYRELLAIYKDLWPAIADWNARLAAFADQAEQQA